MLPNGEGVNKMTHLARVHIYMEMAKFHFSFRCTTKETYQKKLDAQQIESFQFPTFK